MSKISEPHALSLIKAALDSGSIKLLGVASLDSTAKRAEADAEYLLTLYSRLIQGLPAGTPHR